MQSNQTDSPISGKPSLKIGRTETLPRPLRIVFILLTVFGIAVYVIYNFGWTIAGRLMYPQGYYFLLFAMFMAGTFLILPARRKDRGHVPWYDLALAALAFCICIYFFFKAESINVSGWQPPRDTYNLALGVVFAALALEGARRLAGWPFLVLCLVAFVYPQFADKFPGILKGTQFDFDEMVSLFAFSRQGALGMPAMVLGEILIGFLVFCGIVLASGAGEFFLGLSLALLGNYRGGPAKVAVVSSAFFGSLSGNPLANIVTTGSVTIPAMKRLGYPAHYAGAIEACASNGGMIMPPVMGTIAFIIAVFIGVDYATVMIAAIIPAVLYYFGMLMQVDAYAAKVGSRACRRRNCRRSGPS